MVIIRTATAPGSAPIELTVSLFVPTTNPAFELMTELGHKIEQRSNGKLALRIFPSEQLGKTTQQFDLVQAGGADIAFVMHAVTPGRFPLTELAGLPFLCPDALSGTAAINGIFPQYLAAEHAGVKTLFLAVNVPMAVHSVMPLHRAEDFRGKRIRYAGDVVAATLAALGAEPVNIMPLDVPRAMREQEIDATAMTYEGALVNRLASVAGHTIELNANTITFAFVMNSQSYERLPNDLRAVFDEVMGPSAATRFATLLTHSADEGRSYMRDSGVRIVDPSPAQREAFRLAVEPVAAAVVTRLAARSLPAREVADALKAQMSCKGG